eukprot:5182450-Prymnesium_polylepis.2
MLHPVAQRSCHPRDQRLVHAPVGGLGQHNDGVLRQVGGKRGVLRQVGGKRGVLRQVVGKRGVYHQVVGTPDVFRQ